MIESTSLRVTKSSNMCPSLSLSLFQAPCLRLPLHSSPLLSPNLFSQGSITNHAISVYFAPSTQEEVVNGESVYAAHTDHKSNLNLGPDNSKIIAMRTSLSISPRQMGLTYKQTNYHHFSGKRIPEYRRVNHLRNLDEHPVFHSWYRRYRQVVFQIQSRFLSLS